MNEAETRAEHIDPALKAAGWGVVEGSRVLREHGITLGRLQGRRQSAAKAEIADYVLVYRNTKLAVIEAKAWDKPYTEGVGQAKSYAAKLARALRLRHQRPGDLRHRHGDRRRRRCGAATRARTSCGTLTFAERQRLARPLRRRAVRGQGRRLAGRATTRTSPSPACWRPSPPGSDAHPADAGHRHRQDLHRLPDRLEAVPEPLEPERLEGRQRADAPPAHPVPGRPQHPGRPGLQRVLGLRGPSPGALVRIAPDEIRKKGRVPKNGSIFFTIFQTFMSGAEAATPYFGEYPPDFFDFIVIDECHRGGANDESNWRAILEYFAPAVQLGLTATPKRHDQRRHLRLFRRAGVHLFAEGRHQRRLPDAVQGQADRHDARRLRLHARRRGGRRRGRGRASATRRSEFNRSSRSRSARRTASSCSWA